MYSFHGSVHKCIGILIALVVLCGGFTLKQNHGSLDLNINITTAAHAQVDEYDGTYDFLQPLDILGFGTSNDSFDPNEQDFADFINSMIQVFIGFAILLAVIMVIAGGAEYMAARSVTNKDDAKDRIGKAIGGLILALATVVILQTINPNLVEIEPLDEIELDEDEVTNPDIDPEKINPNDTGKYYCYESDKTAGPSAWDKVCSTSQSSCESDLQIDPDKKSGAECKGYLYHQGEPEGYGENAQCLAYIAVNGEVAVQCYSSSGDPDVNDNVDDPVSACSERENDIANENENQTLLTGCKSPDNIDLGNLGTISYDQILNVNVINDDNRPEQQVRNRLNSSSIPINKSACQTVTNNSCTNVGGMPERALEAVEDFRFGYLCNQSTCNITVTGGTSWWFHGNQNINPNNNGDTCHNPEDLGLCSGAVDLRLNDQINQFINNNRDSNGCIETENGKHWFLRESDHWHVETNSGKC
jgi:uncharacterized membrane protein